MIANYLPGYFPTYYAAPCYPVYQPSCCGGWDCGPSAREIARLQRHAIRHELRDAWREVNGRERPEPPRFKERYEAGQRTEMPGKIERYEALRTRAAEAPRVHHHEHHGHSHEAPAQARPSRSRPAGEPAPPSASPRPERQRAALATPPTGSLVGSLEGVRRKPVLPVSELAPNPSKAAFPERARTPQPALPAAEATPAPASPVAEAPPASPTPAAEAPPTPAAPTPASAAPTAEVPPSPPSTPTARETPPAPAPEPPPTTVDLPPGTTLNSAAAIILANFDLADTAAGINGQDQKVGEADLRALAYDNPNVPADVRRAARTLVENPALLNAVDTANGGGKDGVILSQDLEKAGTLGVEGPVADEWTPGQAAAVIDRHLSIVDLAAGSGEADQKFVLADLEAVVASPNAPADLRAAAGYLIDNPAAWNQLKSYNAGLFGPDDVVGRPDLQAAIAAESNQRQA